MNFPNIFVFQNFKFDIDTCATKFKTVFAYIEMRSRLICSQKGFLPVFFCWLCSLIYQFNENNDWVKNTKQAHVIFCKVIDEM